MSQPAYEVARDGGTVIVRALGLSNMKNAPMIDAFLGEITRQQITMVCVDLSSCTGMDSTFMGLLVGRSQQFAAKNTRLVIVNPTASASRLLNMLGLDQVIPVIACEQKTDLRFVSLETGDAVAPRERLALIKRAHEDLASLSDANQGKFAAFLTALERDLARLDGGKAL